ncbi:MAG: arsenate reductase (glutaredoxin) [Alphaproteobacteria bacterium]|nr:arsenate reductase (glutaredoxin) [Alphaproteobacteria bacterium]MDX5370621.1 arsenate reductase (glutaredoxin) [Alphaproteobacteria bacterium]MDX5465066.1 arsenate reductase (glutaredoxin) [Alphaproteobacteria bacterium]
MSTEDRPVIYHNPKCGTSRNTLKILEAAGYDPEVVPYLETGWTEPHLRQLLADAGLTAHDILRARGTPAEELGLLKDGVSEDTILAAMTRHPILVERPIVRTAKGVKLCRPSEAVLDLIDRRPPADFVKENGKPLDR